MAASTSPTSPLCRLPLVILWHGLFCSTQQFTWLVCFLSCSKWSLRLKSHPMLWPEAIPFLHPSAYSLCLMLMRRKLFWPYLLRVQAHVSTALLLTLTSVSHFLGHTRSPLCTLVTHWYAHFLLCRLSVLFGDSSLEDIFLEGVVHLFPCFPLSVSVAVSCLCFRWTFTLFGYSSNWFEYRTAKDQLFSIPKGGKIPILKSGPFLYFPTNFTFPSVSLHSLSLY